MSVAALDYGSTVHFTPVTSPTGDPAAVDTGFADAARGTSPQWSLDTDLSLISSDVYETAGTGPLGDAGWTRVDQATLDAAGIRPNELVDPDSGFQAAIYTDGEGRYVVAFAGTDPLSIEDWANNGQQALGFNSVQYDMAIALAQKAVAAFGADNVVFTGHSLGGGLASAASLATGNPAVTFNASGLGSETLEQVGLTQQQAEQIGSDGQIRRYNVENDILTNAQQGASPLPDAIGYEITLENPNFIEDPIRAHLTGTVIEAMQERDIKSQQDDGLFAQATDVNLFPMGPSLEDIGQTAVDVAETVVDGVEVVVDTVVDVAKDVGSFLNPLD